MLELKANITYKIFLIVRLDQTIIKDQLGIKFFWIITEFGPFLESISNASE